MSIEAINPTSGEVIETHLEPSVAELKEAADETHQAFLHWRSVPLPERAEALRRTAELLGSAKREYAELMALEMGKVLREGVAEIEKCAWVCEYYAEHGQEFLAPEPVETGADRSFVHFAPLGVILAVMPWNFPFWQVFRAAVPALMAGNAVLLKHASNVPGCALAIERLFARAGLPDNVFRTLLIGSDKVDALIEHQAVRGVTLTGSTSAGRAVAAKAGDVVKPLVLELGGSDPYVILHDADVTAAAEICARARLVNAGQSCVAAKRLVVVEPVRAEFEARLLHHMSRVKVGDPFDPATDIGPLARADLRDALHQQVRDSVAGGARCLLGGELPAGPGAFYPPTVLSDVIPGTPAYNEELFGPVAAIIPVRDEAEAITVANDSAYGLGAAVFTRDVGRGTQIATHQLEAGFCAVNTMVRSDPRLPFGGVKESGHGRELSHFGIRAFVNVKSVKVAG